MTSSSTTNSTNAQHPNFCRDYIRACADEALRTYLNTPDIAEAVPGSDET